MHFTRLAGIAAALVAANALAAPQPGDVVYSQDFDGFALGDGLTALPDGWTVDSGTVNVIGGPGDDPSPGHGHYLDLQGSQATPGSVSFVVPVTGNPGIYDVDYSIAGNSGGNMGAIELSTNGVGDYTIYDVQTDYGFADFSTSVGKQGSHFVVTFSTPAFVQLPGEQFPVDTGILLDNVSVIYVARPIPEPPAVASLLAGLGVIALLRRRDRSRRR
jgi:hypothetical protein